LKENFLHFWECLDEETALMTFRGWYGWTDRAFRNFDNFQIRILFFCGKLDLSLKNLRPYISLRRKNPNYRTEQEAKMNDKLPVSGVQYERLSGAPNFGDYWIAHNPFIQEDQLFDQVTQGVNPENWIVRLLQRFSRKGTIVLDIGSNIGCFAIPAALLGYEVIAFEASAPNIELLGESLKKNGLSNVRLIHAAVVESWSRTVTSIL
jgi:2-polyprenyl-3-methyl-5-hydroxy-6-metoxy-1,4-benzoquinol methylase